MALQPIGLDATLTNVPNFTSGIDKMNQAVDSFAQNGSGQGNIFSKGFGEIVTGALRKIGELAVDALAKGSQAIAGFVKDSIGVAGDFQQEFAQFQVAVGHTIDGSGKSLNDFKDLFISLGKELPVSTQEVEQAAVEMARGGIDPAVIAAGGLKQTIQFAAAALKGDLVSAAQISAKTMQAWTSITDSAATKTTFLTHAQNLMTQATTAASTTVDQLFLGLSNVGGTARLAGVSFDETVKALAQLTPSFASSADAGTSLKTFFARLQPETKPAIAAMQELGLYTKEGGSAFYDAKGNFIGMQAAEDLLQKATAGLTNAQREQALQTIFGNDAIRAAGVFALQGQAGYDALSTSISKQTTLTDAAAITQATYNTAVENAKGSVEALQITVGSALLPILTNLFNNTIAPAINTLTDFASALLGSNEAFSKLGPTMQGIVVQINAVVAAFNNNGIVAAIDTLIPGFAGLLTAIAPAASFLKDNLTPILVGVGAAFTAGVTPALIAAGIAFVGAAAPIALIAAQIAAIGIAAGLLVKAWTDDWGGIQEKTASVWAFLEPTFTTAVTWLQDTIPKAVATLSDFWASTLLPALKTVGAFLQDQVFPVLSDLATVYIAGAIIEVKALEAVWSDVLWPGLKTVGAFIGDVLAPIFKALFDVEFAIASKAVEALAGLWQKVLWPALQSVGTYITTTVQPALKGMGDYLSTTFGPTLQSVTTWLGNITGGFTGVNSAVQGVVTWIEHLASSISNLHLPPWLTPGSPTPWEIALLGIGTALQTSVAPGLTAMQRGVGQIGQTIADTFQNGTLIDAFKQVGVDAMAGFGAGLTAGVRKVTAIVNSTASTVQGAFQDAFQSHSPAQTMVPIGASVMQGIMQGMGDTLPSLVGVATTTAEALMDALTRHIQDGKAKLQAELDAIVASIKDIGMQIQGVIADSFGSTASIDRQIAANLDKLKDVLPQYLDYVTNALNDAKQQASSFLDPTEGAKYFAMRSKQILEYADLQKKLNDAATQDDKDRIQAQMNLINAAQTAEISQFNANQAGKASPAQDIATQIQQLLGSQLVPGLLSNDIVKQLYGLLGQIQSPPSTTAPIYNPGAAATTNSTTLNMPIYTNQSPGVLQDSMAIAGAALL